MSRNAGGAAVADDFLWSGLAEHILATRGIVSVAKLLGVRTEEQAKRIWVSSVRPMLNAVAGRFPVELTARARVVVDGTVTVQLGVVDCSVWHAGLERVSVMLMLDPGAVVMDYVAGLRWGDKWTHAVEGMAPPRQVVDVSDSPFLLDLPWVAQDPVGYGRSLSAATAREALAAGLANDVGSSRIAELVTRFADAGGG